MAGEWRSSTWGDEISLEYGKALRGHDDAQGRYRVFGANGPIGWTSEPLAPGPGVILGRKGAYRGVQFSREPFFVIDTAYYVVPKRDLDMRWLYYAIKHYKLGEVDDGSPIPSTTRAAVYMLDIDVPPLAEQHAIAHILGTLDDKIELNRRMNETLEAIARALFKSWFVDFDPVRAKAEGRDTGLPAHLADLFPERFEDSEVGEIPAGWRIGCVGDLGEVVTGKTPPSNDDANYGGEIPFIRIPDMHGRVFVTETALLLSDVGAQVQPNKWLPPLSVCVSCIATPGLVALTSDWSHTNQQINTLIPEERSRYWAFCMLRTMQDVIIAGGAGGSATLNLNKSQFARLPVLIPPVPLLNDFHETVTPLFERILNAQIETQTVAALRDALLPKLISGELRVKDAERIIGGNT